MAERSIALAVNATPEPGVLSLLGRRAPVGVHDRIAMYEDVQTNSK
jgi:hypothetical protein